MSTDGIRDYLDRIVRVPLLRPEEEPELAQAIEVGVLARERLDDASRAPDERIRHLQQLVREGEAAMTRLVTSNLRLVVSVARRLAAPHHVLLDLVQAGNAGLITAAQRFDHAKGFKFSTYATWWIRKAVGQEIDRTRMIRLPPVPSLRFGRHVVARRELEARLGRPPHDHELARAVGDSVEVVRLLRRIGADTLSLQAALPGRDDALGDGVADDRPEVDDEVASRQERTALLDAVSGLLADEASVLTLRFGFRTGDPVTVRGTARLLGVSDDRVRDLEATGLRALRSSDRFPALHALA